MLLAAVSGYQDQSILHTSDTCLSMLMLLLQRRPDQQNKELAALAMTASSVRQALPLPAASHSGFSLTQAGVSGGSDRSYHLQLLLAQRSTDLVEEVQNFLVGLKRICLAIGGGVLLAESLDDRLCFSQFVPEHRWEQMMLDLVIQPTIPEVDQGRSRDSTGGKHLLHG